MQLIDGAGEAIERCVEFDSPVGPLHRIGLSPAQIVDRIDACAGVIGITNMFLHEWPQVREIARLARQRHPDALLVVGGENATAYAPYILADGGDVDCCVAGEGEATFVELVDRHLEGRSWEAMPGVITRAGPASSMRPDEEVVDGGLPVRISKPDLGEVPRPAWDLVPLENYWSRDPFFGVNRGRSMQVLGTRGCPYRCTFCSSPQMWTTKFVVRDPDDVVDEIARLRRPLRRQERQLRRPDRRNQPPVDAGAVRRAREAGPRPHLAAARWGLESRRSTLRCSGGLQRPGVATSPSPPRAAPSGCSRS